MMKQQKTWAVKTVSKLREIAAYELGDHMADWVEQALEWAQRIANGEAWEDVCNRPDTANWYRLVTWKNGYARLIGGSWRDDSIYPASDVYGYDFSPSSLLGKTVPLVVLYK